MSSQPQSIGSSDGTFRVSIFTIDHYQAAPIPGYDPDYSAFRGREVRRVPVLRVFGYTPSGQGCCLHLHGAFPYFLVEAEEAGCDPLTLALSIDQAVNIAQNRSTSGQQHVFSIGKVELTPFYGFTPDPVLFYKVWFYSPFVADKAAELLRSGLIRGGVLKVHEAHLPFHLQFTVDHQLHPMSYMAVSSVKFRQNSDQVSTFAGDLLMDAERMTTCEVEADAAVRDLVCDTGANPGLYAIWAEEAGSQPVTPPKLPEFPGRLEDVGPTESDLFYRRQLQDKLATGGDASQLTLVSLSEEDEEVVDMLAQLKGAAVDAVEEEKVAVEDCSLLGTQEVDEAEDGEEEEESIVMSQCLVDDLSDDSESDGRLEMNMDGACDSSSSSSPLSCSELEESSEVATPRLTQRTPPRRKRKASSTPSPAARRRGKRGLTYSPLKVILTKSPARKAAAAEPSTPAASSYADRGLEDHNEPVFRDALWNTGLCNSDPDESKLESSPPLPTTPEAHKSSQPQLLSQSSEDELVSSQKVQPLTQIVAGHISSSLEQLSSSPAEELLTQPGTGARPEPNLRLALSQSSEEEWKCSQPLTQSVSKCYRNRIQPLTQRGEDVCDASTDEEPQLHESVQESFISSQSNISDQIPCGQPEDVESSQSTLVDVSSQPSGITSFYGSQEVSGVKSFCDSQDVSGIKSFYEYSTVDTRQGQRACQLQDGVRVLALQKGPPSWAEVCAASTPAVTHSTPAPQGSRSTTPNPPPFTPIPVPPSTKGKKTKARRLSFPRDSLSSPHSPSSLFSGLDGPSLANSTMRLDQGRVAQSNQPPLTLMTMEVHSSTRGQLLPDPAVDPLQALFYGIHRHNPGHLSSQQSEADALGTLIVHPAFSASSAFAPPPILLPDWLRTVEGNTIKIDVLYVNDELALFAGLVEIIQRWDPDVLIGYEVEMQSWGLLLQRAAVLQVDLRFQIGRVLPRPPPAQQQQKEPPAFLKEGLGGKVFGREVVDAWRLLRHELTSLLSYTFENVAYRVLGERHSFHTPSQLTHWWSRPATAHRVAHYYLTRVRSLLRVLLQLDVPDRTSELARLYGILWFEVLSRGSQFRVEAMMLRLARKLGWAAYSPGVAQRALMKAPQCIQLIMEPRSKLYQDPVVVLDFQSLYPSIMIAYNYCFSTCLGRLEHLQAADGAPFPFGCSSHQVDPALLRHIEVQFAPCGVAYVSSKVRRGVLPRMLEEILATRLQVKAALKKVPEEDKARKKLLHARQLGLKMIANVTYGYTAASFSGRMPCVEVGDSVVSKGRETLERAMKMVQEDPRWHPCRVVYGDTDSMFVLAPGRTREEAFRMGREMAETVTRANPHPVELKLEKVYQPCILQTKKRYCGHLYESADDQGVYDAKGIETVRRDGCPAVSKILQRSLQILFSGDFEASRNYVIHQAEKLLQGRVSLQDVIFAKEFRGLGRYKPSACVPALEIARKAVLDDPRAEPRVGWRVPYVIVAGPPGIQLIRLVRTPQEFLQSSLRINGDYYLHKAVLPALQRCFGVAGHDVSRWVAHLRSSSCRKGGWSHAGQGIERYFQPIVTCEVCSETSLGAVCTKCAADPVRVVSLVGDRLRRCSRRLQAVMSMCRACEGLPLGVGEVTCQSLDCPVLHVRHRTRVDSEDYAHRLRQAIASLD